jgi:hypothetical protein
MTPMRIIKESQSVSGFQANADNELYSVTIYLSLYIPEPREGTFLGTEAAWWDCPMGLIYASPTEGKREIKSVLIRVGVPKGKPSSGLR